MRTLLAGLLLLGGCATPSTTPAAVDPPPPQPRVLLISVDALNPNALRRLGRDRTPNFHRIMRQGAGTLNARTLFEETETLPNHTSMFTGRRAHLPLGTGVTFNEDNGETLARTAGHYIAGVFDVVHDRGGSTAMFVAKDKFHYLKRSWDAEHGAPDRVEPDDGTNKIDRFVYAQEGDQLLVRRLDRQLGRRPATFTFLHLSAPDVAGHAYGGMSRRYLRAVRDTDARLGRVLAAIESSPTLKKQLTVVLTADHGTAALRHGDPTKLANYRIPFLAWGAGVAAGANLYALNPEFLRPGRGRPTYEGRQPIRNGDAANLVADLLGLPPVPGSEFTTLGLS